MPTGVTYAKGIQNIGATVSNGYLLLNFEVVDNYNTDTSSGDSTTQYSYFFPSNLVSLKLVSTISQGVNNLFELSYQNEQVSFSNQEYYDISNGQELDPSAVYGLIIGALNL